MSVIAPPAGVRRRTIVCVNNVAGRATTRSIITGMIVRAEKSKQWIVQAGFLQPEKHRIGAIKRPETALGQTIARPTIGLGPCGESKLQLFFAAFFENA